MPGVGGIDGMSVLDGVRVSVWSISEVGVRVSARSSVTEAGEAVGIVVVGVLVGMRVGSPEAV